MSILEVKDLRKTFGKTEVLKGISFSLEKGEVLSIIGSSGSGCLLYTSPSPRDWPARKAAAFRACVPAVQPFSAVHGASEYNACTESSEKGDAGRNTGDSHGAYIQSRADGQRQQLPL